MADLSIVIVTTSRHVLAIDVERLLVKVVHSFGGLYFGVAADVSSGSLFIATRSSYKGSSDKTLRANETGSLLVFDASLVAKEMVSPPFALRDLHGICINGDEILVSCSFDNMVARYNMISEQWSMWYPHPDPLKRGTDINHFNSIAATDESFLLVAHNWGGSDILEYDKASLQLKCSTTLGVCSHDAWFENEVLHTLSSGEGLIRAETGVVKRTNGFPRGYVLHNGNRIVGLSSRTFPSERTDEDGAIRIFDAAWTEIVDIVLPKVGMVNAIAVFETQCSAFERLPTFHAHTNVLPDFNPRKVCLNKRGSCADLSRNEWHVAEDDGSWTAARHARLRIVVNAGTSSMSVRVSTSAITDLKVLADDELIFDQRLYPGNIESIDFELERATTSQIEFAFICEELHEPANGDRRLLGVKVHEIKEKL